jgi:hypothetical protein
LAFPKGNYAKNKNASELRTNSTAKMIVALKITFSAPLLVVWMVLAEDMDPAEKPAVLFCIIIEKINKNDTIS